MNYYNEIKNKLIDNEVYIKVKDYSKERHTVITYFEIGSLLYEAGKEYGENIIGKYSEKLMLEVGKKYNKSTLFRMRQFYIVFSGEKVAPAAQFLSWSHIIELLPLKNINQLNYYINECVTHNLSKRKLREKIKSKEYERLDEETRAKLKENNNHAHYNVTSYIKNPIIIKNKYNYEVISEKLLKQIILDNLDEFLLQLGNNFAYISNEYKIKVGNRYNYIDILLFNIEFNCYVVIELKVTELKKQHIGQIHTYINYIDKNIKKPYQDKTIGIIICKKNNKFIMEYCSDKRIVSKEYELV